MFLELKDALFLPEERLNRLIVMKLDEGQQKSASPVFIVTENSE